nr:MAG TPA: hypothetical protein [Caudoviricetes sp.]
MNQALCTLTTFTQLRNRNTVTCRNAVTIKRTNLMRPHKNKRRRNEPLIYLFYIVLYIIFLGCFSGDFEGTMLHSRAVFRAI